MLHLQPACIILSQPLWPRGVDDCRPSCLACLCLCRQANAAYMHPADGPRGPQIVGVCSTDRDPIRHILTHPRTYMEAHKTCFFHAVMVGIVLHDICSGSLHFRRPKSAVHCVFRGFGMRGWELSRSTFCRAAVGSTRSSVLSEWIYRRSDPECNTVDLVPPCLV